MKEFIAIDFGEECSTERIFDITGIGYQIRIEADYKELKNVMDALQCEHLFNGLEI